MLVREARALAREWVTSQAASLPGFHGAYFAGSAVRLPDDAALPSTSDLDVNVVLSGQEPPVMGGKLLYRGLLLDVTFLALEQIRTPDRVLGHYHLAGGFRSPSIIMDPSGYLTDLQRAVARDFARRDWVRRRCGHARRRVLEGLASLDESHLFHDQVIEWIFPTGVTTHVLLVAGLENPTVRRRYRAVRELLTGYGHSALYKSLLELLGCAHMGADRVDEHLAALTHAFDAAAAVNQTAGPFSADISPIARALAIDGSRDLIARGDHREAVFWMTVTYARCQKVLGMHAPELKERFDPGLWRLLADLGITTSSDLRRRAKQVKVTLPYVWHVAESIMAVNAEIKG